ncbi:hypothetical protein DXA15_21150 [Parabacteroides sp. AM58-2XD]|nr:hypothetical protein DXA15_21150 [Parabacteroides sp. AM58-2XD]
MVVFLPINKLNFGILSTFLILFLFFQVLFMAHSFVVRHNFITLFIYKDDRTTQKLLFPLIFFLQIFVLLLQSSSIKRDNV